MVTKTKMVKKDPLTKVFELIGIIRSEKKMVAGSKIPGLVDHAHVSGPVSRECPARAARRV